MVPSTTPSVCHQEAVTTLAATEKQYVALEQATRLPSKPVSLTVATRLAANHLPPFASGSIVILINFLLNVTFFIIVPTSASYANQLGASTWFSGLTIGISTFIAGLFLIPFSKRYTETYKAPFLFSIICFVAGEVVYALAGVANTAWLMFLGRVILGAGFVSWMFVKRYMTDPIVVGTARRTMMSACLVTSQATGMAVGPFVGGLFSNKIQPMTSTTRLWNGFTASGWVMAAVWAIWLFFVDPQHPPSESSTIPLQELNATVERESDLNTQPTSKPSFAALRRELNRFQLCSVFVMCWFSMVNFFVLDAWESNIPVFGHIRFGWTDYQAGNVIALGGLSTLPILIALVFVARYFQDRTILAAGLLCGLVGLSLHLGALQTPTRSITKLHDATRVDFGSFFSSWFLVALGYNMLTTITLSLLSKQIPSRFNGYSSLLIQLSNYLGRITGALWGTTVFQVGQFGIVSLELAVTLLGTLMIGLLWRRMVVQKG